MARPDVIEILREPPEPVSKLLAHDPRITVDEAVARLCQFRLLVAPVAVPLFGLRDARGCWLVPDHRLDDPATRYPLELRLRFKVPTPGTLQKLDAKSFEFFYQQVREEFRSERVISTIAKKVSDDALGQRERKQEKSKKLINLNFYYLGFNPPIAGIGDDNATRLLLFSTYIKLVTFIMVIDMYEKDLTIKSVFKNFDSYVPYKLWSSKIEKTTQASHLKSSVEDMIQNLIGQNKTGNEHKLSFLEALENLVPNFFSEEYETEWHKSDGTTGRVDTYHVKLVIKPPFRLFTPPYEETDAEIQCVQVFSQVKEPFVQTLATVEDICYINLSEVAEGHRLELARRNGIPLVFVFKDRPRVLSFLGHVCGYYRLSEKWTFSLCGDIIYPSLNFNLANKIHGPIRLEDVDMKFLHRVNNKPGSYIIRQCPTTYGTFYLHAIAEDGKKPRAKILSVKEGYKLVLSDTTHFFLNFRDLTRFLHDPESPFPIKNCLHPSEYDRFPNLLLCRPPRKLRADLSNSDGTSEGKKIIPIRSISKVENQRWADGEFCTVWKGQWSINKEQKVVAIKQLNPQHRESHLASFLYMTHDLLLWSDSTLVKAFGTTLANRHTPMAVITEFFPLGNLKTYLTRAPAADFRDVDLVEACASLARAVWYLDENELVHGNVRCSNVFVAERNESVFKVKLGDAGMFTHYPPESVHWLPYEMLATSRTPAKADCTIKSDVYALGTTFWEIFTLGRSPSEAFPDAESARDAYIRGERLPQPERAKHSLADVFKIMKECWFPIPDIRKDPQATMRDMNRLLHRVFNAKTFHSYMTIDDGDSVSMTSGSTSNGVPRSVENPSYFAENSGNSVVNAGGGQDSTETVVTNMNFSGPTPTSSPFRGTSASVLATVSNESSIASSCNMSSDDDRQPLRTIPMYNELMARFTTTSSQNGQQAFAGLFGSLDPLFPSFPSRPGSASDSGSPYHAGGSQATYQTSLGSVCSAYSMSTIYQIHDKQLEFNKDFPLGEGNFGVVFKGVMTRSNGEWDEVAIKMLKDSDCMSLDAQEEMRRELDIMKSLDHDCVVKIKGIYTNDKMGIIMEYLRDGSLDRYLFANMDEIRQRSPKQLFLYAHNIIDGMEYLRQKGIIHRDLAARNILVANEELVKISDFGLARYE